jgi:inhibitor of KinA
MRFEALGDQAVLAYCDDENGALAWASAVRSAELPWRLDVVQAYTSVAVYYDIAQIDYTAAVAALPRATGESSPTAKGKQHRIPCCYELGLDFAALQQHSGLTRERIVKLHAGTWYTVYAIGFCPGFPYMGYLPEAIAGLPRLPSPRLRVEAGSVGLTGRQTGIYTEPRPGGWNIVGRTPLELVNVADGYFPLRTGDQVRFEPIDESEYRRLLGERL